MTAPTLLTRVDWWARDPAAFSETICTVKPLDTHGMRITRGRNADFSGDATGQVSFTLDNTDGAYSEERNWHDNGGFIVDTAGWSTTAIASLTAAATSITRGTSDKVYTASGSAVLTATVNSGVTYAIPYRFRAGITYSFSVSLKSSSGNLNVRAGIASAGTPADIASTSSNITTGWVTYSGTWTPSADRTDAVFFVRTTTAAAATVLIDGAQVNPGSTLNAYLEAPTKGQLQPGRPVHVQATYSATVYPLFYGFIERLTPDPSGRIVTVEAYDPLARMSYTPGGTSTFGSATVPVRAYRAAALEAYACQGYNAAPNPVFATNTDGWTTSGAVSISRITTDGPIGYSTSMQVVTTTPAGAKIVLAGSLFPALYDGEAYQFSAYIKLTSGSAGSTFGFYINGVYVGLLGPIETTWKRVTVGWTQSGTVGSQSMQFSIGPTASTTFLISAISLTRGPGIYPYGTAGRAPSYCVGEGYGGWTRGWSNWVTNPSFETNTTGWSALTSNPIGETGANYWTGNAITRIAGGWDESYACRAENTNVRSDAAGGITQTFSQTFKSGTKYYLFFYADANSSNVGKVSLGVAADYASMTYSQTPGIQTMNWTPSADRTGVTLNIWQAGTDGVARAGVIVDAIAVTEVGISYFNVSQPAGTCYPATTSLSPSVAGYYNTGHVVALTIAKANDGAFCNLAAMQPKFLYNQPYRLSLWIKASTGTANVEVGIGYVYGVTVNDTATSTVSVGTSWTQVEITWTPTGNRNASIDYATLIWVKQTGSTARTLYVDGVRVIAGSATDSFEPTEWAGMSTTETGSFYLPSAMASTGTVLTALGDVNAARFSRHWVSAKGSSPWWQYNTAAYTQRPSLAETVTDAENISSLQSDRNAYATAAAVTWQGDVASGGVAYYGSESAYNLVDQVIPMMAGSRWTHSGQTSDIGAEILSRYGSGHKRPQVTRRNSFPGILARELNEVVAVDVPGWLWPHFVGSIERMELSITNAGQEWTQTLFLDEWPYAV